MPIRQLAPDVAAKIAAGEVVERPASVVKELIENSIDAGATQIRVDLTNGGLQLIRVTDNGCGIPVAELPLALSRHATSKVSHIDDLEHIHTLGFRGEALASIAAVADVTLLSHARNADQGAQVQAANGEISEVGAAASPVGTTLTVRNLFSSVPARLKFLKGRNTEIAHCHHMLEQYALAYPEIRFSVFSEGRQLFSTRGDGHLASVLIDIYGLQIAGQMIPISSLDGRDGDPERPVATGYTSRPACYKSTRQHISFFVNRRWVMSRMLTAAVEEAYHSLLLTGRHPIAVVNITIDPSLLDVNVHPAKTEIRFLKERRVYSAVQRAVRSALLETPEMPSWGQGNIATRSTAQPLASDAAITGGADDDNNSSDSKEETFDIPQDNPWLTVTEEESGTRPPMLSRLWQSHIRHEDNQSPTAQTAGGLTPTSLTPTRDVTTFPNNPDDQHVVTPLVGVRPTFPNNPDDQHVVTPLVGVRANDGRPTFPGDPDDQYMVRGVRDVDARQVLPQLRVIGQLAQSYIVTEGPDGMYVIDQHAAHERIILERMLAAMKEQHPLSQMILTPIQLELDPKELEAVEEQLPQLTHIGFDLDIQDGRTLLVRAVPNVLVKQMNARSIHELLTELTAPDLVESASHSQTWEEHALANVACKAAIKANYFLTVSEMREMIEQLGQTNAPYSCCHGRPTTVHFGLSALEREFGRR
jgi:DNA mismatch repair protein MutL